MFQFSNNKEKSGGCNNADTGAENGENAGGAVFRGADCGGGGSVGNEVDGEVDGGTDKLDKVTVGTPTCAGEVNTVGGTSGENGAACRNDDSRQKLQELVRGMTDFIHTSVADPEKSPFLGFDFSRNPLTAQWRATAVSHRENAGKA